MLRYLPKVARERNGTWLYDNRDKVDTIWRRNTLVADCSVYDTLVRCSLRLSPDSDLAWLVKTWSTVSGVPLVTDGACMTACLSAKYTETAHVLLNMSSHEHWGQCVVTEGANLVPLLVYAINNDMFSIASILFEPTITFSRVSNLNAAIFRYLLLPFDNDDPLTADRITSLFTRMSWLIGQFETVNDTDVCDVIRGAAICHATMCYDWMQQHAAKIRLTYMEDNKTPITMALLSHGFYDLAAMIPHIWPEVPLGTLTPDAADAAFSLIGDLHAHDGLVSYLYACTHNGWDIHRVQFEYDVSEDGLSAQKLFWVMWYFMYAACHTVMCIHFRRCNTGDLCIWSNTGFALRVIGYNQSTNTHPIMIWLSHMCDSRVSVSGATIARDIGAAHVYHDALCRDRVSSRVRAKHYRPMPMELCDNDHVLAELNACRLMSARLSMPVPRRFIGFRHSPWIETVTAMLIGCTYCDTFIPHEMVCCLMQFIVNTPPDCSYREYAYTLAVARSIFE